MNNLFLIKIAPYFHEATHFKWEELRSRKDCSTGIFTELINTKNILTNEDLLVCKHMVEEFITSSPQFKSKIDGLEKLIKNTNSDDMRNIQNEICPTLNSIWDIVLIDQKDTTRIYRVNNIELNIKNKIEEIIN